MAINQVGSRRCVVTTANNGDICELGPAGTNTLVSTFAMQFHPSLDFVGTFQIMARVTGPAAANGIAPFLPVPYRRVAIAAVASDRAIVSDPVVPAALIEVPASGLSLGVLVNCTAGRCQIFSWDLHGSAAF